MSDERREFQRLNLTKPIDGWLGDFAIRLLDVSAIGALIEHDEPIESDSRALLQFYWRGQQVEITSDITRDAEGHAGLRFVEDSPLLRRLIAESATEVLRAQEANASGDREHNIVGDETLTAASSHIALHFVTWLFDDDGSWTKRASLIAEQPPNGFTVTAAEPADQVELLRSTYESGDAEGRRLIRMLAELSVAGSR